MSRLDVLTEDSLSWNKYERGNDMQRNSMILRNGLLIDGTGKDEINNVSICIRDGKIESIFYDDITTYDYRNYRVIELDGQTILPGFINTHVHSGFKHLKGEPLRCFQKEYLRACLYEGVTTVRDEGMFTDDSIESVVEKKRILENLSDYPRVITTGKIFSAPGGYGGMQPIHVTSEKEAREKVNDILDKGIDMIKTVLEDGLDPSTYGLPKLSEELLRAICSEAHKRRVNVSAHVTQSHNLKKLVEAGINDAAHVVYDDLPDELATQMIEKDIYIIPTLTVLKMINDKYGVPVLEQGKKNVLKFVQMGGKIGLGDDFIEEDLPWYKLGMPIMELQLLKEAGLSNMQIIVAATKNGANICGIDKEVGTIEVGKRADLFIIDGNPLKDLNCIRNVRKVIKNGVIVVEN